MINCPRSFFVKSVDKMEKLSYYQTVLTEIAQLVQLNGR